MTDVRPFAIGDYIKIRWHHDEKAHLWATVETKGAKGGVCVVDDKDRLFFTNYDLLTIRSQRKGSAESRAIVAISASYYRAKLNKRFRNIVRMGFSKKDAYLSATEYAQNSVECDIYTEQLARLQTTFVP